MYRINLDRKKEDRINFPRQDIKFKDDMTPMQMEFYTEIRQKRDQEKFRNWKNLIESHLVYKKPNFVDAHHLKDPSYKYSCEDLYVFPCFMKVGKQSYLVHEATYNYYSMHTTICNFRTEDPPKCKFTLISEINLSSAQAIQKKKPLKSLQKREQCVFALESGHT